MKKFKIFLAALTALTLVFTAGLTSCGTAPSSDTTGAYITEELTDENTTFSDTASPVTAAPDTVPSGTLDTMTAAELLEYSSQAAMTYTSYKQNTSMDITLSILGSAVTIGVTMLKVKSGDNASLSVSTGDSGDGESSLISYVDGSCYMASDSGKFIQKNADAGTFVTLDNASDNTLLSSFRYDMFKDAAVVKTDTGYAVTGGELDASIAAEFAAIFGESEGVESVSVTSGSEKYEFDSAGNLLAVTLRLELTQDLSGLEIPYSLSVQLNVSEINADFAVGAPEDADSYVEVSSLSDLIAFIDASSVYSALSLEPCEFSRALSFTVSSGELSAAYTENDKVASSFDSETFAFTGSSEHKLDVNGEITNYKMYCDGEKVVFSGDYEDSTMTPDDVYSLYSDILASAMIFDSTLITSFTSDAAEGVKECSFSLDSQTGFDCMAIYLQLYGGITVEADSTYEVNAFIGSLAMNADGVVTGASFTIDGTITSDGATYAVSVNCAVVADSVGTSAVTPIA